ncbi:hypothetical protein ACIPZG_24305 [Pseudomonas sp. NPDC089395]|uniref:hypothetical protein n=1 Tax=Pseudomonas sp. NPDC089395 TaxID=3364460 RepID=UPI00380D4673
MRIQSFLALIIFSGVLGSVANATPLGRLEHADLTSINSQPAICLPRRAEAPIAVGWVILAESFAEKGGVWSLKLKKGATPLVLKPGDCFTYGVAPEAYEFMKHGANERPLRLEVNKAYSFRLHSALQSTDVYTVAFCVGEGRAGQFEFYKRSPSSSREQAGMPCKASESNSAPE